MTTFPDLVVSMDGLGVDRGHTTYRWTATGTHTDADGARRAVRFSGHEQWRIGPDGLIAESRGHFDEADYQRQMSGGTQAAR